MDEKRFSARDIMQSMLGDTRANGLPEFASQDVPKSNPAEASPFAQSQLGQAIQNIPSDTRSAAQRMEEFKNQSDISPDAAQKAAQRQELTSNQNRMKIPSDDIIGGNPISSLLKSIQGNAPASTSGQAPLTPEQLQAGNTPAAPVETPEATPTEKEVPATTQAPKSAVKEAFQATQSPEQKQAAQDSADTKNPLVDTEMQNALNTANENRSSNASRQALFEMMAGIGSLGGKTMSGASGALDQAIKTQDQPLTDINTQRDEYKKFLSNKEEKESQDANSQTSKFFRDTLEDLAPSLKGKLGGMSRSDMEKTYPAIIAAVTKRETAKQHSEDLAATREANRLKSMELGEGKQQDKINKARTSLMSSERMKKVQASSDALSAARANLELAKTGHSQGYAALGANLAIMAGEKGMLSEADVNRYLKEKGIPGKIQSGIFETTGTPTKEQLKKLGDILDTMGNTIGKRATQFAEDELSALSYGNKVNSSEIEKVLPELKRFKEGGQPQTSNTSGIRMTDGTHTVTAPNEEEAKKAEAHGYKRI